MKRHEQNIKEIFDRSLPLPSQEQTEFSCDRVLRRFNVAVDSTFDPSCGGAVPFTLTKFLPGPAVLAKNFSSTAPTLDM